MYRGHGASLVRLGLVSSSSGRVIVELGRRRDGAYVDSMSNASARRGRCCPHRKGGGGCCGPRLFVVVVAVDRGGTLALLWSLAGCIHWGRVVWVVHMRDCAARTGAQ